MNTIDYNSFNVTLVTWDDQLNAHSFGNADYH